jgi:hypothetical protein
MIDMLKAMENCLPDGAFLATLLLGQAGIKPAGCDCEGQCGCQYQIEAFEIDVIQTRIVDDGQERRLVTWKT